MTNCDEFCILSGICSSVTEAILTLTMNCIIVNVICRGWTLRATDD
jgi:hypothetical protein